MTADRNALQALDRLSHRVQDHIETIKARGRTRPLTVTDVRELHVGLSLEVSKMAMVVLKREQKTVKRE